MQFEFGKRPDAIRGGASLVVALAHAWQIFLTPLGPAPTAFAVLVGAAMWSVAIFFIISGLLIAVSVKRRIVQGRFDLSGYMRARCARIFPPLAAAVVITAASVAIIRGFNLYGAESYLLPGDQTSARTRADFSWWDALNTITLLYNLVPDARVLVFNGPLWSLSYEFWFYVVAGLALSSVYNMSIVSITLLTVLIGSMIVSPAVPPFWSVGMAWVAGFIIGWFWNKLARLPARTTYIYSVGTAIVACLIAGKDLPSFAKAAYSGAQQQWFYVFLSLSLSGWIILLLRSKWNQRLRSIERILERSGTYSYTLYVIHFPLFLLSLSLFRPLFLNLGLIGHAALGAASTIAVILFSRWLARLVEDRRRFELLFDRLFNLNHVDSALSPERVQPLISEKSDRLL